ncbi:MAG TPA: ATP-binding protein [Azospirillum sp.]|nr:ATP-binding protein [Azospirillum sp.]
MTPDTGRDTGHEGERARAIRQAIFDNASHLIIATDEAGTIIDVNPAAERALGYTRGELVGRTSPVVIHDRDEVTTEAARLSAELGEPIEPGFEAFVALARRGRPVEREWTYIRRDGTRFPVLLAVTALPGRNGTPIGFVGISTDLTERKAHERALIETRAAVLARRKAESDSHAKTHFLAAASHDLRQPLQSALLFASALAPHVTSERGASMVSSLEKSLNALRSLLDRLLDISKLDAGEVTPQVGLLPASRLLDELNDAYAPRAAARGLGWRVVAVPATLRSDPELLGRILRNLIENALRYTEQGGVALEARVEGAELVIDVRDTGPGIAPEHQEAIFREFHRLQRPDAGGERGLGLGLAIVRRLANLLGHPLTLRSRVGEGSVFTIRVALDAAAVRADASPAGTAEPDGGGGRAVLVIEDDALVRAALVAMIRQWGYDPHGTASWPEAQAWLDAAARPPAVVVTDYRLPDGTSGVGVLKALAARPGPAPRGILLTGETASGPLREAQALGYTVLQKPIMPAALHRAIAGDDVVEAV